MNRFKIVYENNGKIALDEECTSLKDAIEYQITKSPFQNTMILEDDGSLNISQLTPEEAKKRTVSAE